MPLFQPAELTAISRTILEAAGTRAAEAAVVAEALVDAELMGLPSHGLQRIVQYVGDIGNGIIVPGAEIEVEYHSPTTALVDGHWNFGQIVTARATEAAIAMANEYGIGAVVVRGCRHIGRVGAYTEMCAAAGCIGVAMVSSGAEGHWVAPFGGREGRLGTNPISFAAPTEGEPIVMDFSTSAVPEGKVRLMRDQGNRFSEPVLVDSQGRESGTPDDLYAADGSPAGAILPFGGDHGYKGYGLSLMVGILASSLGQAIWNSEGLVSMTNGSFLLALRIGAFGDADGFCADVQAMSEYICSAAPIEGCRVMLPGQREFEARRRHEANGVVIEDGIWQLIRETAASVGVELD